MELIYYMYFVNIILHLVIIKIMLLYKVYYYVDKLIN